MKIYFFHENYVTLEGAISHNVLYYQPLPITRHQVSFFPIIVLSNYQYQARKEEAIWDWNWQKIKSTLTSSKNENHNERYPVYQLFYYNFNHSF